jgi:hypothetical protein
VIKLPVPFRCKLLMQSAQGSLNRNAVHSYVTFSKGRDQRAHTCLQSCGKDYSRRKLTDKALGPWIDGQDQET